MNKFSKNSAFAALTLSLAACAGSPSLNTGQRISERGGEITQYGADWKAGNKSVRDGEKLMAKSTDRITDARKKLSKAENDQAKARKMIADGQIQMQQSKADYDRIRTGPPAVTPPQSN